MGVSSGLMRASRAENAVESAKSRQVYKQARIFEREHSERGAFFSVKRSDDLERIEIKYMPVDELLPYVNNPRKNDKAVEYVANSIKEFGFKVPIVVDEKNEVIAGHTRLKASKKLGIEEVPVIVAGDLSEEQVRAFRLADNKVSELAEWDTELLDIEIEEINFNLELFGFDVKDDIGSDSEVADDGFEVNILETSNTKVGDIFQLGRHRLMCGDSTNIEDVKRLVGNQLVDMYLTDPPYNVAYQGKTSDALTIQNDEMNGADFREFLKKAFGAANEVMKPGAVFYIWHADSEGYNFRGACFETGWQVRQCLIWNKNSMVLGRQDYHWKHEPCLYGWKDGAAHLWASNRKQTTILEFDRPNRNAEHPTMKPIPLFDYQIKNNTKGEDVVLDTFGGSGTTLMACEQNGRNALVMELDPRYVDVIIRRWETFTGLTAEKIN